MQQFYYLAVLFVAGGIGSALIVAATCVRAGNRCALWKAYGYSPPSGPVFSGYGPITPSDAPRGTCPCKPTAPESRKTPRKSARPAKGGGIGENGNERKVGSAGQETENRKPGTGRRKDLSVAGTDPWKVSEPEPAMNMPEPAMTGMQMENGTTTEADGAEDMPG